MKTDQENAFENVVCKMVAILSRRNVIIVGRCLTKSITKAVA